MPKNCSGNKLQRFSYRSSVMKAPKGPRTDNRWIVICMQQCAALTVYTFDLGCVL